MLSALEMALIQYLDRYISAIIIIIIIIIIIFMFVSYYVLYSYPATRPYHTLQAPIKLAVTLHLIQSLFYPPCVSS